MKTLKIFTLMMLIVFIYATAASSDEYSGYFKKDIIDDEVGVNYYKGDDITCRIQNNKCCYETYEGEICVDIKNLSRKKIEKIDLYIKDVKYSDDKAAKIDSCRGGESLEILSDSFKWSYGFTVGSSELTNEKVTVEVSHVLLKNGLPFYTLSLNKVWRGNVDSKCHVIIFSKKDVSEFIEHYNFFAAEFDIEFDLNLEVLLSIRLFSSRPEGNYQNNIVEFNTWLPIDSAENWPPLDPRLL